jgi:hypothetical protein
MEIKAIEDAGGIKMPQAGRYVIQLEKLSAAVDAALTHGVGLRIIGKTSATPGAALIVEAGELSSSEKSAQDFFVNPPNAAGLSQALIDVVQRRS